MGPSDRKRGLELLLVSMESRICLVPRVQIALSGVGVHAIAIACLPSCVFHPVALGEHRTARVCCGVALTCVYHTAECS